MKNISQFLVEEKTCYLGLQVTLWVYMVCIFFAWLLRDLVN